MRAFDIKTCSHCGDSYSAHTGIHSCTRGRECSECGSPATRVLLDVQRRETVAYCDGCLENGKPSGTFRIYRN